MKHVTDTNRHIDASEIRGDGLRAQVLSVGASLFDLSVDLPSGPRRVILRLASPQSYPDNPHYLGVIAGRCANRIRDGHCSIGGTDHQLDRNENGVTHLHGGSLGFSRKHWSVVAHSDSAVTLSLDSEAGDQGYPGNAKITCTYEILPDMRLRITLRATSDADTLMNLAAHAYFNLEPGTSILDHHLRIDAGHYTPVDDRLIPDGRILPVGGTSFDFRTLSHIGERRRGSPMGFDHNFVLAMSPFGTPREVVMLVSPSRDLGLQILTTEPGLQFYDGQKLSAGSSGQDTELHPFAGCCLEPQRHPDAVHHPHFAQAVLLAGQSYEQVTEYKFVVLRQ